MVASFDRTLILADARDLIRCKATMQLISDLCKKWSISAKTGQYLSRQSYSFSCNWSKCSSSIFLPPATDQTGAMKHIAKKLDTPPWTAFPVRTMSSVHCFIRFLLEGFSHLHQFKNCDSRTVIFSFHHIFVQGGRDGACCLKLHLWTRLPGPRASLNSRQPNLSTTRSNPTMEKI